MRDAVIVSTVRTAVGKAPRGTLKNTRPDDMAAVVMKEVLARADKVKPEDVQDVVLGCAMPEAEQGMNVARIACFAAGLPHSVPAYTVNRFCSSGLQAIANVAERVQLGAIDIGIGGGTETMSMIPMGGNKIVPNPTLAETFPAAYIGMGTTAEVVAERYGVTRQDQDEFAATSHARAAAAIKDGKFESQIAALKVRQWNPNGESKEIEHKVDEGVRAETTVEGLGKLRPVFSTTGSVTAGNSSQMSDGAAASLIMSDEKAKELGLTPMAAFRGFTVVGCHPDEMGIGPALAIPALLEQTGLKIEDIDLFEVNEAFAAQSVYSLRKAGVDPAKANVNGGAIALGHPLGCTGAKLTTQIIYELQARKAKYGIVTMCIGGGMGAAGLFENLQA